MSDEHAELRGLAEAATPGPWDNDDGTSVGAGDYWVAYMSAEHTKDQQTRDAAFIAAANPTAVLGLLDEVERLRATVERVRAWCDKREAMHAGTPLRPYVFTVDLRAALAPPTEETS